MNRAFAITLGQFLSFLALGIGVAFGLYFCGEAIVAECRRWGKWREARRLVRQAEATEAMKAWRGMKVHADASLPAGEVRFVDHTGVKARIVNIGHPGSKGAEVLREMQKMNDLMGGKK